MEENIIKFYKSRVYVVGMTNPKELSGNQLNDTKDTRSFAFWMLSNKIDACIDSVKSEISRILKTK